MTSRPIDYGLPQHDKWRIGQLEAVEHALETRTGISIYEQPTGSGKTAFCRAIASKFNKSASVCSTRVLQTQYINYGYYMMQGKANFPCVHPDVEWGTKANECISPSNMYDCISSSRCEYLRAKSIVMASKLVNVNYHLWMSSAWIRSLPFDYVCFDEAQLTSDLVLDWVGATISQRDVIQFELPAIPKIENMSNSIMVSKINPVWESLKWLNLCMEHLNGILITLIHDDMVIPSQRKYYVKLQAMRQKCETVADALVDNGEDWYIRSGLDNGVPKFIARPLTARYHAPKLFCVPKIVMMSATIGLPEIMAKELGIKNFRFLSVPSVWPSETRPIYVLDCPSMGHASTQKNPGIFDKQAEVIAEFIGRYPKDWPGLILVTRRSEAKLLADRLAKLGLQDRIFPFPETNTAEQVRQWEIRKQRKPNSIGISFSFWEGFDGVTEKLLCIAKIPFGSRGEPGSYEHSRMEYDYQYYNQQTALKLEQGCGRIRRGEPEHYDLNGVAAKAVAIADGSIGRVRKYFSQSFLDCLVYEKE
jgi:Rad3-related DNA helicase